MEHLNFTTINTMDINITVDDKDNFDLHEGGNISSSRKAVFYSIVTAASLFGMLVNGMVIWCLLFRIHRNSFTIYILNLAIADFSFLLIFLYIILWLSSKRSEDISVPIAYLCVSVILFGYVISQYLLMAISMERCVSVLFPIWYRCHRSKHQSTIVCAVLWGFSILTHTSNYFLCVEFYICLQFFKLQSFSIFVVLLPLTLLSNVILIIAICRNSQRRHPPRLYILIITTVFAYLFFALPLAIFTFLLYFDIIINKFVSLFIYCPIINSSINPVIYYLVGNLRKRQGKWSVTAALRRAFSDKPDPPEQ